MMIVKIIGTTPIKKVSAFHQWASEQPIDRVIVADWDSLEVNLFIIDDKFCIVESPSFGYWSVWEVTDL